MASWGRRSKGGAEGEECRSRGLAKEESRPGTDAKRWGCSPWTRWDLSVPE